MAKLSQLFDLIKTETVEDGDVIAAVRDIEGAPEDVAFTLLSLKNAIVKAGSNDDGDWLKIYLTETTGWMICAVRKSVGTIDNREARGAIFRSAVNQPGPPYPHAFERVIYTSVTTDSLNHWIDIRGFGSTTNWPNWRAFTPDAVFSAMDISCFAIGTFDDEL